VFHMGRGVQAQTGHQRMVHEGNFRRLEIRFRASFLITATRCTWKLARDRLSMPWNRPDITGLELWAQCNHSVTGGLNESMREAHMVMSSAWG
jgi:hypothetical protein